MAVTTLVCAVLAAAAVLLAPGRLVRPVTRSRLARLGRRAARAPRAASRGPALRPRRPDRPGHFPAGSHAAVPAGAQVAVPAGAQIAVLADQLAALARAGLSPARSWAAVAEHGPSPPIQGVARAVVAGHRGGRSAAAVLRGLVITGAGRRRRSFLRPPPAHDGGAVGLLQLALALEVSERTGAGLSQTLGRLAEALRAEQDAADELGSALAGPRATAGLLTFLPAGGLVMGALLGGRPWHVLLFTAPGRACLVCGGVLWLAGRSWAARLARRAVTPR